jgi:three-Cys-motif partner protein
MKASSFERLERLRDEQPSVGKKRSARTIELFKGDFNNRVSEVLRSPFLTEKEATFCLLDQRTFECHWSTIEALARHKRNGNKIELFYFLACAWFDRAISRTKNREKLNCWWGTDGWKTLREKSNIDRAKAICDRRVIELGDKHAQPFAILGKGSTGRVMYYMIHATDHPIAPTLMVQAYNNAVKPLEPPEQLGIFIQEAKGAATSA